VVSLVGKLPDRARSLGATVMYYRVFGSANAAQIAYHDLRRESFLWRSQAPLAAKPTVKDIERLSSATFCVETWSKWCNLVVDSTVIEVDSRLPLYGFSSYRMRSLIESAVAHYEDSTTGR
jgi:hypothetical protein